MEIFTYVIEGQLEHRDSMGNGSTIEAGDLQYMSAGSGVQHSEFNPSKTHATRLYQIWVHPGEKGGEPRYAEKRLGEQAAKNGLSLLFSGDGREGSTEIRQDAEIWFGQADEARSVTVSSSNERPHAWLQVIEGELRVLGESLRSGDGIAIEDLPGDFSIETVRESRWLLFRLSETNQ